MNVERKQFSPSSDIKCYKKNSTNKDIILFISDDGAEITSKEIFDLNNLVPFCRDGSIHEDFLKESVCNCDYVFLNTCRNTKKGFACVSLKNDGFYIDLICDGRKEIEGRLTRSKIKTQTKPILLACKSGKDILDYIYQVAKDEGKNMIQLRAVNDVISYYLHFEYNFQRNPLETKQQIDEYKKSLQSTNDKYNTLDSIYNFNFEVPEGKTTEATNITNNYDKLNYFGVLMEKPITLDASEVYIKLNGGRKRRKNFKNTQKKKQSKSKTKTKSKTKSKSKTKN